MTDYISNITTSGGTYPIGGDNFDGKWVFSELPIYEGFPSSNSNFTYDLSTYLPNDSYDYELLIVGYAYTRATNGSMLNLQANSGSSTGYNASAVLAYCFTRTNSSRECGSSAIIPIKNSDKKVTIFFADNYLQSGNKTWVTLYGYRRVGINGYANNAISNITIMDNGTQTNIPIGGDAFAGQWIGTATTSIFDQNYTPSNTYTTNLKTSNLLPNDNYEYEIIIDGQITTGSTSGNWAILQAKSSKITTAFTICGSNTRTSNVNNRMEPAVIPLGSDGSVSFYINATSGTARNFRVRLRGYRRLGTNS